MIELTPSKQGVLLNVLARPGARREGVQGEHDGALRVAVNAPPEKGKANAAVVAVLADALGLKPAEIALVAGEGSRRKRVLLSGLAPDDAARRIAEALAAIDRRGDPPS